MTEKQIFNLAIGVVYLVGFILGMKFTLGIIYSKKRRLTLFDVIGNIFPCIVLAPFYIIMATMEIRIK